MMSSGDRPLLQNLFRIGVERCQPKRVLPSVLPKSPPKGRTIILGAGKAAAEMAAVAVDVLEGPVLGCVVTRYGGGVERSTGAVKVIEAGHPVPDEQSLEAGHKVLSLASSACAEDRVIFLISGGGSALLTAPIDGVSLHEKQQITDFLIKSGAPIDDINFVRTHLSRIKGGRLSVAAFPAEQMTFIISDVVRDRPEHIASGPTIPMTRDPARAMALLRRYGWRLIPSLEQAMMQAPVQHPQSHAVRVVATNGDALHAIERDAGARGWRVFNLGDGITGEASLIGKEQGRLAGSILGDGVPTVILSGGEATVKVTNRHGRGGPNLEYLAGFMTTMPEGNSIVALACDSDGIDGTEQNAGGYVDGAMRDQARNRHLKPDDYLKNNDTYTLFEKLDGLIETGPTYTNVNDIRIILVNAHEKT